MGDFRVLTEQWVSSTSMSNCRFGNNIKKEQSPYSNPLHGQGCRDEKVLFDEDTCRTLA